MEAPKKYLHMTVEEFMVEHEASCNLGFKHGADMVLKMVKLILPEDDYESLKKSVRESPPYLAGKKYQEVAETHAASDKNPQL